MNENIKNFAKSNFNFINLVKTLIFKFRFMRNNPFFFDPAGIWVFTGCQGSGKTLSAVNLVFELHKQYPKALICSNMLLHGLDNVIPFTNYEQIFKLNNGSEGIIFLIDEVHILWNSLESKDISFDEMASFCQNRKDRRVIVGTSQVYSRIAKPIREQLQYIVACRCFFGLFQLNTIIDPTQVVEDSSGHLTADGIGKQFFFHCPDMYLRFDTYNKINKFERRKKNDRISKKYIC